MSLLSRAFTGPQEKRTLTDAPWFSTPYGDMTVQGWATMPGEHTREGDSMALGAFYACVTLLADIIASLPLRAYRRRGGVDVLADPQPTLFRNSPYPETTWFSWLWMLMESMAITGNGFGYITGRDDMDNVTGIMPIHPDFVAITIADWQATKWPTPIYTILGEDIPPDRIVHIKRYPLASFAWGMSPVQKARSSIELGLAAEKYGLRYFRDSANPSGILTTDQELTPTQVKQTQKQWIQNHQNRRLPAVMSGGLQWTPITLTPEESQFLSTRQYQVADVARFFRVPLHMIQETTKSTSWGSGLAEQNLGFVKYTLMPWLAAIEQAMTNLLPRGQFAKFDLRELLRADDLTRWETYRLARDTGAVSANEIRAEEDRPPIGPEGDIHLQPANFIPLGQENTAPPPTHDPQPYEPFKPSNKPKPADDEDGDEE